MLRVTALPGNRQRLDGGAMFGNAPRALWSQWLEPDEQGRVPLACRAFLVEDGTRRILIETGVGAFLEPRLRERFGVFEDAHVLLSSLERAGLEAADIDVVLLSHLHFDHAGGLLGSYRDDAPLELAFPEARYVVGREAWDRARAPHPRDRASFIAPLPGLLEASGRLTLLESGQLRHELLGPRIEVHESFGHTPGMLIPLLEGSRERAAFCADLVPGRPWVHLPITMGYDRFPEALVDEKRSFYQQLGEGGWLLFTHDPEVSAGRLARDERGRFHVGETRAEHAHWDLDEAA